MPCTQVTEQIRPNQSAEESHNLKEKFPERTFARRCTRKGKVHSSGLVPKPFEIAS